MEQTTLALRLIDAAHILLEEAAKLTPEATIDGVTMAEYFKDRSKYPLIGAKIMNLQYAAKAKPHEYVAWTQGVLPEDSGTGEGVPPEFDQYKPMWEQAQRDGVFDMFAVMRQGRAAIIPALQYLYDSDWGIGWRNDPRTKGMIPPKRP